jgi:hypothetical protein
VSTLPTQQDVKFNVETVYTLPLFADPEGQPMQLILLAGPSFVSIKSLTQISIYPTLMEHINVFSVTIEIADFHPLGT